MIPAGLPCHRNSSGSCETGCSPRLRASLGQWPCRRLWQRRAVAIWRLHALQASACWCQHELWSDLFIRAEVRAKKQQSFGTSLQQTGMSGNLPFCGRAARHTVFDRHNLGFSHLWILVVFLGGDTALISFSAYCHLIVPAFGWATCLASTESHTSASSY